MATLIGARDIAGGGGQLRIADAEERGKKLN
jgi:hypothetical protein